MSGAVERIAVVGRDAAAWIAALGLRRALGPASARIEVLELPSMVQPADVYAAVPSLQALHNLLGLPEELVLGACSGVPMMGQRFSNWGRSSPPFLHGYDAQLPGAQGFGFLPYWLKARAEGLGVPLEDFSLAAAAAKQGRLALGDWQPESLSAAAGYQLDASSYVQLLREVALRSGIERKTGAIVGIDSEGERIHAVRLGEGGRIEADLFIDASGAEAALIGRLPGGEFTSWRQWLPCDRTLAVSGQKLDPLPAFSQISAFHAGWVGLHPLQDRTSILAVFDSARFSDAEMLESVGILSGLQLHGEAVVAALDQGVRARAWIGNCVAIGEAAVALEPLDAMQLHVVHIGLSHLVALFPVDSEAMPEAAAYNATIAEHADNIRDFQIAHYRLNRRYDEPLWDRAREARGPDSLDSKLALFESRGLIALYDGESFQEENWASVFAGHGMAPRSHDPRIDIVPREEHFNKVQGRLRLVADEVSSMPTVEAYLRTALPQPPAIGA